MSMKNNYYFYSHKTLTLEKFRSNKYSSFYDLENANELGINNEGFTCLPDN